MKHNWVRISICLSLALRVCAETAGPRVVVRPRPARSVVPAQPLRSAAPGAAAVAAIPPQPGGFQAVLDDGTRRPPDSNGAVGLNYVVTMLNSEVQVQDRGGRVLSRESLDDFWGPFKSQFQAYAFDPRIAYDAAKQRWIASAVTDSGKASSLLLLGASQTSDPTGPWFLYSYPIDTGSENNIWADYPVLGFNSRWVAVTANIFDIPATGGADGKFLHANVYLFDKAALYGGSRPTPTIISDSNGNWVPVTDYDNNTANPLYLVESAFATDGMGALQIAQPNLTARSLTTTAVELSTTWAESAPNGVDFAPQLGSTAKIDAGDSRMQGCMLRKGSIWCVQTIFLPAGLPTRSSVQWYQIDPANPQAVPTGVVPGLIDDATGTHFYAEPSLAANQNGDVLIGYSRFSANEYPAAGYSLHAASDLPGTVEADVIFKPGEAPYARKSTTSSNVRWGDFSTTVVDPVDGLTFWTLQEYASTPQSEDRWGTWWARVAPPAAGAAPCTYSMSQASTQLTAAGGSGSVQVTAGSGCLWMAAANASWINVTGTPGAGSGTWNYVANGNSGPAARSATVTAAGQTFTVNQDGTATLPKPQAPANGITNAASYATGAVAPGELIAIFGNSLGPPNPWTLQLDSHGNVATDLDGTSVSFDGYRAPIVMTSAGQVNAVVPFEVAGQSTTKMQLAFLGVSGDPVTIPVTTTAPGLFTANASGTGQGAILNGDLSPNSAANPAAAGSTVVLYLTGAGVMKGPLATGSVPTAGSPTIDATVQIGGQNATVQYAGVAPGLVAGVVQINVVIPNGLSPGDKPVLVTIGGNTSQAGVTVAVR